MTDTSAIEAAAKRLRLALEALEAAVERCENARRAQETLAAQLHALGNDRHACERRASPPRPMAGASGQRS